MECSWGDGTGFPIPAGFTRVEANPLRTREGAPVRVVHPDPGLAVSFAPDRPIADKWYQLDLHFPAEGVVDVLVQFVFAGGRVFWQRLPARQRNQFLTQIRLDGVLQRLNLYVTGSGRLAEPSVCRFEQIGLVAQFAAVARRGVEIVQRDGFGAVLSALSYLSRLMRPGSIVLMRGSAGVAGERPYDTWVRVFDEAPEHHRPRHEARLAALSQRPLISILLPIEQVDLHGLDSLVRTLMAQVYPVWELIVAAPTSQGGDIRSTLARFDSANIRLIESSKSVAEKLNMLLSEARGNYVLPSSLDARLRAHALLDLALTIDRHPQVEVIYSDEDRCDSAGRQSDPRFKPAWSPELLEAYDFLGSLKLLRAASVRALGGWRADARDMHHDLVQRLADRIAPDTVVHLAKVLVHATAETKLAAPLHVSRRHDGTPTRAPRVSIIIPTRDNASMLETCIESIRVHTPRVDYEIIVIDNESIEETTTSLFAKLSVDPRIRILRWPGPFNFSAINNFAVRESTCDFIALVNNDIEAIEEGWLEEMASLAARPDVGCVGARLLYPDGSLQHGGIILGYGGVAGHAHRFAPPTESGYLDRLRMVQNVSAVTAACLVIRKNVFHQVGGLDEDLAVAFNDVDFGLKVGTAGYRNLWTPFATLVHHESMSRGRDVAPSKARRFASEHAIMQRRWGPDLLNDPYYSPHLTFEREDFSIRIR